MTRRILSIPAQVVIDDPMGESGEPAVEAAPAAEAESAAVTGVLDFGAKKKKPKKVKAPIDDVGEAAAASDKPVAGADLIDYPDWPDYTYDDVSFVLPE